jgi:hypothetical protein
VTAKTGNCKRNVNVSALIILYSRDVIATHGVRYCTLLFLNT